MTTPQPFYPQGVPPAHGTDGQQLGPGVPPSPFIHEEKPAYPITARTDTAGWFFEWAAPLFRPFADVSDFVSEKRKALGLPFPGTAEHLQRETKSELARDQVEASWGRWLLRPVSRVSV